MNDKIIKLLEIASQIDVEGFSGEAEQLDKCAENLNMIKQAQYDGVQGYWVRNSRCWQNCYRQKRSSSPDKPIQEVWSECHGEFVGSLYGGEGGDWGKYADTSLANIKIASLKKQQSIDVQFNQLIDKSLVNGDSMESAVADAIVKQCSSYVDLMSEVTTSVLKVADSIKNKRIKESITLVDIGDSLTKEAAGFWRGLMDTLRGGAGYGGEVISDSKSRGALTRESNDVVGELNEILLWAQSYNKKLNSTIKAAQTSVGSASSRLRSAANETIRILSQKGIRLNERALTAALNKIKKLPYATKFRGESYSPSDERADPLTGSGSEERSTPEATPEATPVGTGGESSPRTMKEYVANNIGIAQGVATTMLRRKYETGGRDDARELLRSLGLKGASTSYNLKKQAQFADLDKKRGLEDRIRETRSTRKELKEDKVKRMTGLARSNFDQFLIAIMAKLGTIKFTEFINNVVGRNRDKSGKFKPSVDGFRSPAPGPIS